LEQARKIEEVIEEKNKKIIDLINENVTKIKEIE